MVISSCSLVFDPVSTLLALTRTPILMSPWTPLLLLHTSILDLALILAGVLGGWAEKGFRATNTTGYQAVR